MTTSHGCCAQSRRLRWCRANTGNVKLAVLLLKGCSRDAALSLLERAGGELRAAIDMAAIGKA